MQKIDNSDRYPSSDHPIEKSCTIPLMIREHIHSISPEKYREKCEEKNEDDGKYLASHVLFSFFDDLISTERPWVIRGWCASPTCHPGEYETIDSDKYEEISDDIGDELWIDDDDTSEYETKKCKKWHRVKVIFLKSYSPVVSQRIHTPREMGARGA